MLKRFLLPMMVSTHSRLKAAGKNYLVKKFWSTGFNTQPPEGGWFRGFAFHVIYQVSTHSRLKAAGY